MKTWLVNIEGGDVDLNLFVPIGDNEVETTDNDRFKACLWKPGRKNCFS